MAEDLKKLFGDLKKKFQPGVVGQTTTFYLSLGDEKSQKWTVTLGPDDCSAVEGKVENADVVLKTSADLFVRMTKGEYRPGVGDFLSGKVKSNDPEKLELLEKAFAFGK
ncbi:MAG: hypothetical protein HYY17_09970 [Planctomycetes bacterium]|nr:hypothetical protein [Planctomycetota bacterium]